MTDCIYCDKVIGNDETIQFRFEQPMHTHCMAELNEELANLELASGLVPQSPYYDGIQEALIRGVPLHQLEDHLDWLENKVRST